MNRVEQFKKIAEEISSLYEIKDRCYADSLAQLTKSWE